MGDYQNGDDYAKKMFDCQYGVDVVEFAVGV